MQVKKEQLQRQQEILGVLGFYHGKFDGIWGPKSIEAKKRFEADARFVPGIPNNGLPFADKPPYPALMTLNHQTGLLEHPALTAHVTQKAPQLEKAVETKGDDEAADDTSFSLPG
jgi:hypothetical protein